MLAVTIFAEQEAGESVSSGDPAWLNNLGAVAGEMMAWLAQSGGPQWAEHKVCEVALPWLDSVVGS